ncbi:MAG: RCC1 domain-containing protein [Tepidiformaceae bacterium]
MHHHPPSIRCLVSLATLATVVVPGCDHGDLHSPSPARDSVAAVVVGFAHTCALLEQGDVFCWGSNDAGQLGIGAASPGPYLSPTPVGELGQVEFLTAGHAHTCVLDVSAQAYCWGLNSNGQLGVDSTADTCRFLGVDQPCSTRPVAVSGGLTFTSITAGGFHTCGLATAGTAYCWGDDFAGQLGIGSSVGSRVLASPTAVVGGHTFATLDAGYTSTCGITTSRELLCWGANSHGQLGLPVSSVWRYSTPTRPSTNLRFVTVSASSYHSCALDSNQAGYCWGANYYGQLGNASAPQTCGGSVCSPSPLPVAGATSFIAIAAGNEHSCGIDAAGTGFCWGQNFWGNLGNGGSDAGQPSSIHPIPERVVSPELWRSIVGYYSHTCALNRTGALFCWGDNHLGQLGNGTRDPSPIAFRVGLLTP